MSQVQFINDDNITHVILTINDKTYCGKYDGFVDNPRRVGNLVRFNNYLLAYFMIDEVVKPITMSLGEKIIIEAPNVISPVPETKISSPVPETKAETPKVSPCEPAEKSPNSIPKVENNVPSSPQANIVSTDDDKITITIVGLKGRNATINIGSIQ
jgi:hypothetical protein